MTFNRVNFRFALPSRVLVVANPNGALRRFKVRRFPVVAVHSFDGPCWGSAAERWKLTVYERTGQPGYIAVLYGGYQRRRPMTGWAAQPTTVAAAGVAWAMLGLLPAELPRPFLTACRRYDSRNVRVE